MRQKVIKIFPMQCPAALRGLSALYREDEQTRYTERYYPLPLLIIDKIGGAPDNSNRTVNQTLRKDWNIVIDKGFIAKIQVYPTDFLLNQNRIYSTES